jgi:hypothetical protein
LTHPEAKQLLFSGYFSGAYYLGCYAVECGLKACIAKQFKRNGLPDKVLVARVYTPHLEALLENRLRTFWRRPFREPVFSCGSCGDGSGDSNRRNAVGRG